MLTLTFQERKEIVGYHYGFDLRLILGRCYAGHSELGWSTPETVTFEVDDSRYVDVANIINLLLISEKMTGELYVKLARFINHCF